MHKWPEREEGSGKRKRGGGEKREGHQKSVGMQEHDGKDSLQKPASKVGKIPPEHISHHGMAKIIRLQSADPLYESPIPAISPGTSGFPHT